MARRKSIDVPTYSHKNPIPGGSLVGNIMATGIITGRDPKTGEMPAALEDQVVNMFGHIKSLVEAAGGTMDDVVKLNVLMQDSSKRAAVNDVWLKVFPDERSRPARQTAQVNLEGGMLVQCDFLAVIGG